MPQPVEVKVPEPIEKKEQPVVVKHEELKKPTEEQKKPTEDPTPKEKPKQESHEAQKPVE